jgi:glutamyl-tRNA synthetase
MLKSTEVRTRFAPSPTGYMHVGNLRTALYAYLLTKSKGGKFILRIEDTDQERYVEGAVDVIYKTLKDTGLVWDEGPDVGGPVGPYIQSERRDIYKKYAKELVERGGAYYCFCTKERLDEMRRIHEASGMTNKYDGHCRSLSKEEIGSLLASGVPYVIRQRIPKSGETTFHDEVFGDITAPNDTLDDNILLKTDGLPTYNFANVVDDHLMGITHVIRGIEYLSSAPKYNLLYKSFGWEIPVYIHCPPVMKDATQKLSKRNGDASFEDLLAKGYLKDAILNYIALLGWCPGGEREIFTLQEMVEAFDVSGISKSPAIFDNNKLDWINGEYIRAMTLEQFHEKALPWIRKGVKSKTDTKIIAEVLQPRCVKLSDIPEQLDFIDALPDYSIELYTSKKMKTNPQNSLDVLKAVKPVLEALSDWNRENIHEALFGLVTTLGVKNGVVLWPVRVAVSGKQFTPGGAVEICVMLGKEESLRRIDVGIALLSKRQ